MVKSNEDLEVYLNKLERRFERLDDGTFLVGVGANVPPAAVRLAPPVVLVRVAIGDTPEGDPKREARVFRRLLELNGSDLLHAAYAIEDGSIVLSAALENDTLDLNELEAVFSDLDLALAEHVSALREMAQDKG